VRLLRTGCGLANRLPHRGRADLIASVFGSHGMRTQMVHGTDIGTGET
jgi:hypothetical protein